MKKKILFLIFFIFVIPFSYAGSSYSCATPGFFQTEIFGNTNFSLNGNMKVSEYVDASQFCLNSDCISNWNEVGSGGIEDGRGNEGQPPWLYNNSFQMFFNVTHFPLCNPSTEKLIFDGSDFNCSLDKDTSKGDGNCSIDGSCENIFYGNEWNSNFSNSWYDYYTNCSGMDSCSNILYTGDAGNGSIWIFNGSKIFPTNISANVGVGTTSPSRLLTVDDDGIYSATFSGRVGIGTTNPTRLLTVDDDGTYSATFSGRVGIGTTNPYRPLHVYGSAGLVAERIGYDTTYYLDVGYDVSNEYGYLQALAGAGVYDDIVINPNGGKVGIGTATPRRKLDILDSTSDQLRLSQVDNSVYSEFMTDSSGDLNIAVTGTKINFGSENIVTTGNIGAGTTTPGTLLHVYRATGNIAPWIETGDGSDAGIQLISTSGQWNTRNSGGDYQIKEVSPGNAIRMVIKQGGKVGVGTTAPDSDIHIYRSSGTATYKVESGNANQYARNYVTNDLGNMNIGMIAYGSNYTGTFFGIQQANATGIYSNNAPLFLGTADAYNVTIGAGSYGAITINTSQDITINKNLIINQIAKYKPERNIKSNQDLIDLEYEKQEQEGTYSLMKFPARYSYGNIITGALVIKMPIYPNGESIANLKIEGYTYGIGDRFTMNVGALWYGGKYVAGQYATTIGRYTFEQISYGYDPNGTPIIVLGKQDTIWDSPQIIIPFIQQYRYYTSYENLTMFITSNLTNYNLTYNYTPSLSSDIFTAEEYFKKTYGGYGNEYHSLNSYRMTSPQQGTIVLELPDWFVGNIRIKLNSYDYNGAYLWSADIGGYSYSGKYWAGVYTQVTGNPKFEYIRYGYNGTQPVILLGNTSTVWEQIMLDISEVSSSADLTNINIKILPDDSNYTTNFKRYNSFRTPNLTVRGNNDVATFSAAGQNYINIQSNSTANTGIKFTDPTGTRGYIIIDTLDRMSFYTQTTEKMRLTETGYLGIGTTVPDTYITIPTNIGEGINSGKMFIGTWNDGVTYGIIANKNFRTANSSTGYALAQDDNGQTYINSFTGQPLNFAIGGIKKAVLSSDGYLGIGTTNPNSTLDVNGNITLTKKLMFKLGTWIKEIGQQIIEFSGHVNFMGNVTIYGNITWTANKTTPYGNLLCITSDHQIGICDESGFDVNNECNCVKVSTG